MRQLSWHESPTVIFVSCLVFGCSVSSVSYRRQDQDECQYPIYAGVLGAAIALGHGLRESMDLIVFGYLLWATCIAMVISLAGHSLFGWVATYDGDTSMDLEKARGVR